jgi:hypothetical protein
VKQHALNNTSAKNFNGERERESVCSGGNDVVFIRSPHMLRNVHHVLLPIAEFIIFFFAGLELYYATFSISTLAGLNFEPTCHKEHS